MQIPNNKKTGRPKKSPDQLRRLTIGVRLSPAEWRHINAIATKSGITPTTWLRVAALGKTPPHPPVPKINSQTSRDLGHLARNINQLTHYAHLGYKNLDFSLLHDIAKNIKLLRQELLGITNDSEEY